MSGRPNFLRDTERARAVRDKHGVPAMVKVWRGLGVEGWRQSATKAARVGTRSSASSTTSPTGSTTPSASWTARSSTSPSGSRVLGRAGVGRLMRLNAEQVASVHRQLRLTTTTPKGA